MKSIKMLAIAPNETMETIMKEIASRKDNLIIDTWVGNLYPAVEYVKNHENDGYDVILSRGETAAMLKKSSRLPVVEIQYSMYDALYAVKFAETFQCRFAIVGFVSITSIFQRLNDLLQMNLDIITISAPDQAKGTLLDLKSQGYQLIITGMCIDNVVKRCGLNNISITSSHESIEDAIDQAIPVCTAYVQAKERCQLLHTIIQNSNVDTLVYDNDSQLIYHSVHGMDFSSSVSLTQKDLNTFDATDSDSVKIRGKQATYVSRRMIRNEKNSYTAFYLRAHKSFMPAVKNDIPYYTQTEAADLFLGSFDAFFNGGYKSADGSLDQITASPLPVLFVGEAGTGKEQLAAYVYTRSVWQNHPYIVIDFHVITDKLWAFLFNNINSPLNSNECTIYFRGIEALTTQRLERLITAVRDSHLCSRNKVLFSYMTTPGKEIPDSTFRLMNHFSCICVHTIPLRQRTGSLPMLINLFINELNSRMEKQIVGIAPEAMPLLLEFAWTDNLTQLKRLLSRLVSENTGPFISLEAVKKALADEGKKAILPVALPDTLDLKKPLAEIEKDIVKSVLADMKGNQSQAALRLGICRTTLWRILNKS